MKLSRILHVAATAACLLAISCTKQSLETTFSKQETQIESFIGKLKTTDGEGEVRVEYHNGSSRAVVAEGSGEELKDGGTVSFYYAGYSFSGSLSSGNMFSTNHEKTASDAGWTLSGEADYEVLTITLGEEDLVEGLRNGLVGVRGGEECYILFSGKHGFKKNLGTIPANSALLYHIWVESISND